MNSFKVGDKVKRTGGNSDYGEMGATATVISDDGNGVWVKLDSGGQIFFWSAGNTERILIEEQTMTTFKIGDKVRRISADNLWEDFKVGDTGIVQSSSEERMSDSGPKVTVKSDRTGKLVRSLISRLELAPSADVVFNSDTMTVEINGKKFRCEEIKPAVTQGSYQLIPSRIAEGETYVAILLDDQRIMEITPYAFEQGPKLFSISTHDQYQIVDQYGSVLQPGRYDIRRRTN